jgi:acetoin:2,6-dichlorophenolindophenol oxidoreductase subunit beta
MSEVLTYSQAFQAGVREEMERDPSILILGTDLFERGGHFAQVHGLGPEFGSKRVRDTPISEAAMVAAGVGAALNGARPLVELNFIDFAFGAMDEIANQAAKIRHMWGRSVPLVIRATSGVATSAAQHNNSLEAWFAHTPGLAVAMPSNPSDTKGLIKTALRADDPVIFMMHKRLTGAKGPAGGPDDLVPFGQAAIRRVGKDVTVVTYSHMVETALTAASELSQEGIDVEVIDLRTVFPLDLETVESSVKKTGRVVVASEAPRQGGIGAEVAAAIQENVFFYLDAPVRRVGARHAPIPHSMPLVEAIVPGVADIRRAVLLTLETGSS